jgi:hypothetical protein
MDPNVISQIAGQAYVKEMYTGTRQEQDSQDTFAAYDALTPAEPPRVWVVAKRLLVTLLHSRKARQNAPVPSGFAPTKSLPETVQ